MKHEHDLTNREGSSQLNTHPVPFVAFMLIDLLIF